MNDETLTTQETEPFTNLLDALEMDEETFTDFNLDEDADLVKDLLEDTWGKDAFITPSEEIL